MVLYPEQLDDESTLPTVRDQALSTLAVDWKPGDDKLTLESARRFPESGFVTVYVDRAATEQRALTFEYADIDRSTSTLLNVKVSRGVESQRPAGSHAVANVMAEHHNGLANVTASLESLLGSTADPATGTIEEFARELVGEIKKPRPWFEVDEDVVFVGEPVAFFDRTYRVRSGQSLTYSWKFGDGFTSSKKNPNHTYKHPGFYDITLRVTSEFGEGALTVRRAIQVRGLAPGTSSVTVTPMNAIANETIARLVASPPRLASVDDDVVKIAWSDGQGGTLAAAPSVTTIWKEGGLYRVSARQTTRSGAYSISGINDVVNVVERNSLWVISNERNSSIAALEELIPSLGVWKTGHHATSNIFTRSWSFLNDEDLNREETFIFTGAIHTKSSSFNAYVFWNQNPSIMQWARLNLMTSSWSEGSARNRGYGWTTGRILHDGADVDIKNKIYVMFGAFDPLSTTSSSIASVDVFDMSTETFTILSSNEIANTAAAEEVLFDAVNNERASSNTTRSRWRSAAYKDDIYLAGVGDDGSFTRFVRYSPITSSWKALEPINIQSLPVKKAEGNLVALSSSLYWVDNTSEAYQFNPIALTWRRFISGSQPAWADNSSSFVNDQRTLIVTASGQESPSSHNNVAYIMPRYSRAAGGAFNELTRASSSMPTRSHVDPWRAVVA